MLAEPPGSRWRGPRDAVERLSDACPIVGSYGARDWTLRGRAERLEHALSAAGVAHDVKEYPDAGHSFMNRLRAGALTPVFPLARFGYREASAEDAWRRILAFFAEHLS